MRESAYKDSLNVNPRNMSFSPFDFHFSNSADVNIKYFDIYKSLI